MKKNLAITTKIIFALFFIFLINSCQWFTSAGSPFLAFTNMKIPDGTPNFQKGFKDGCSSTLYSRGNIFYRTRYKYRYDPKMIGNAEYRFGHQRGYTWCFQTVLGGAAGPVGSFDKALNPYGYDATFNAGNINDAWGGMLVSGGAGGGPMGSSITSNGFNGIFDVLTKGGGGTGNATFSGNPLWAGGSKGQFLGWGYDGTN